MAKGVLDGQNSAPRVPVENEVLQPEAAPHFLDFRGVPIESPKPGIIGLVGVVAAELVVVVHLDSCLRNDRFEGLEILVAEPRSAVEQKHLDGAEAHLLGPDFVLAADHREHSNAGGADAWRVEAVGTSSE